MSDSEESVGADIEAAAEAAISTLLPAKSRAVYELSYQRFDQWLGLRKLECISEKVMLAYFMQRSKLLKPSTMWSEQSEGYRGKKSKVFTKDEVHAFLKEANDETYLILKVLLIVGISGACRRQELLQLSIKDIEDMGEFLKIQILETKTKKSFEDILHCDLKIHGTRDFLLVIHLENALPTLLE
ncbi:hypothetical protein MTP99_005676 [Tenebrio molitor]|nr:hypothetical protein MTP99_005676 [Tenebrio molitor]